MERPIRIPSHFNYKVGIEARRMEWIELFFSRLTGKLTASITDITHSATDGRKTSVGQVIDLTRLIGNRRMLSLRSVRLQASYNASQPHYRVAQKVRQQLFVLIA